MKKLMIAAAIAFTAVASQASVCKWKFSSTSATPGVDGSTVYVVLGSSIPASFSDLNAITALSFNGSTGYKTTTATKPQLKTTVTDSVNSSALTSANPNLYLVLVNSEKSGYAVSSVQDATAYLYESGGSSPGTLTVNMNTVSFTSFGGSGDVPEPTSAMLLLLGVAGLALRRKQA